MIDRIRLLSLPLPHYFYCLFVFIKIFRWRCPTSQSSFESWIVSLTYFRFFNGKFFLKKISRRFSEWFVIISVANGPSIPLPPPFFVTVRFHMYYLGEKNRENLNFWREFFFTFSRIFFDVTKLLIKFNLRLFFFTIFNFRFFRGLSKLFFFHELS